MLTGIYAVCRYLRFLQKIPLFKALDSVQVPRELSDFVVALHDRLLEQYELKKRVSPKQKAVFGRKIDSCLTMLDLERALEATAQQQQATGVTSVYTTVQITRAYHVALQEGTLPCIEAIEKLMPRVGLFKLQPEDKTTLLMELCRAVECCN